MANAIIIGETFSGGAYYSTWAKLRTVFGNPGPGVGAYFSTEYPVSNSSDLSLKSAASGSGLIRGDTILYGIVSNQYITFRVQAFNIRLNPLIPGTYIVDYRLALDWWYYAPNTTLVASEVQSQLIGQTVTLSIGSPFNITSDLFTISPGKQTFLLNQTTSPGYVTAIGKLTPIT